MEPHGKTAQRRRAWVSQAEEAKRRGQLEQAVRFYVAAANVSARSSREHAALLSTAADINAHRGDLLASVQLYQSAADALPVTANNIHPLRTCNGNAVHLLFELGYDGHAESAVQAWKALASVFLRRSPSEHVRHEMEEIDRIADIERGRMRM